MLRTVIPSAYQLYVYRDKLVGSDDGRCVTDRDRYYEKSLQGMQNHKKILKKILPIPGIESRVDHCLQPERHTWLLPLRTSMYVKEWGHTCAEPTQHT